MSITYPSVVEFYDTETIDAILMWAFENGASDISLVSNRPIWIRRYGTWFEVTKKRMGDFELSDIVETMTRQQSISSVIKAGEDRDFAYQVIKSRSVTYRFRVNATAVKFENTTGIEVVLRTINGVPPLLEEQNLPDQIVKALKPRFGLVFITGPVGSGKTTLIAASLRDIIEKEQKHVLTYEAPIEFDLMSIENAKSLVVQSEIPSHLKSFDAAPRNSLRRAGDVILFGESRDKDTIRNMTIASETGVAVYTTAHTNSVSETISRLAREFPLEERDGMASTLIASTRLIVHQRLIPKKGGGRIPIREWLIFDAATRNALVDYDVKSLSRQMHLYMQDHPEKAQTLISDLENKRKQGLIEDKDYVDFTQILSEESEH